MDDRTRQDLERRLRSILGAGGSAPAVDEAALVRRARESNAAGRTHTGAPPDTSTTSTSTARRRKAGTR